MTRKKAHLTNPLVVAWLSLLTGCSAMDGSEPQPASTLSDIGGVAEAVLEDPSDDGVPGLALEPAAIASLVPLGVVVLPLAPAPFPAPAVPVHGDYDLDFVPPTPDFEATWTQPTLDARDLDALELAVSNRSGQERTFALMLVLDGGTTRGEGHVLGSITVPARSTVQHRVDRAKIPESVLGARAPGLLQLALRDGVEHTLVLPAFYTMPRQSSALPTVSGRLDQLMSGEELERKLAQDPQWQEPGAALSRVVVWQPDDEGTRLPSEPHDGGDTNVAVATFEYTTCVRWQAQTIDSGHGEDRISWGDSSTALVTAYGVRVRVMHGSWYQDLDTSPTSGCVTWTSPYSGEFSARVYAYVKDSNDNVIRYHDAGDLVFGTYPGSTYSIVVSSYYPSTSSTTYLNVGSWTPRYTAMATASMVSRYYPGYTSNTQTHVADDVSGGGSSAHHCSGASCLYANGDAYVRLQIASSDHRRRKFITAHELGHARAILAQDGTEPNTSDGLASGQCSSADDYSMVSREWNSIGLREGYAHFVAAWTYNYSSESDGWIRWFDTTYDVEFNNPSATGGFIGNNCGGVTDGHSVNLDVLRTLWDWTTPEGGASTAERADVAESYERMVRSSPSTSGYWNAFDDAAAIESSAAERGALLDWGHWNGLYE